MRCKILESILSRLQISQMVFHKVAPYILIILRIKWAKDILEIERVIGSCGGYNHFSGSNNPILRLHMTPYQYTYWHFFVSWFWVSPSFPHVEDETLALGDHGIICSIVKIIKWTLCIPSKRPSTHSIVYVYIS